MTSPRHFCHRSRFFYRSRSPPRARKMPADLCAAGTGALWLAALACTVSFPAAVTGKPAYSQRWLVQTLKHTAGATATATVRHCRCRRCPHLAPTLHAPGARAHAHPAGARAGRDGCLTPLLFQTCRPNGAAVTPQSRWGHAAVPGGEFRFLSGFKAAGNTYTTAICMHDTDGDGQSNGRRKAAALQSC